MNRYLKASSSEDRIRPQVIVVVATAILATVAIPFAVIRATWLETKPAFSKVDGKPTDHSSSDECIVAIPQGVNRIEMTASNGVLLLEFSPVDTGKRLSVEIGQASVLCRFDNAQEPVQGRTVRLTRDGMTTCQGRDGKFTVTTGGSSTTFHAIGDQVHMRKDGFVWSSHRAMYGFP